MKRVAILASIVAGGLAAAVYAQGLPGIGETEKVSDNVYKIFGAGGNTTAFVRSDGVVLVDTKLANNGPAILAKVREFTDKPVTMIINTHTHGDHVSGNVEFPATVEVVTHENTAKNMQEMRTPTGITPAPGTPANIFKENGGRGMPKRTFKDNLTLGKGDERIELHYFGRGHTNGDAFVVFPALRLMHSGDIFSGKNIPLLDAVNGGSGVEIGRTLAKAAEVKGVDRIITGHSTVMTVADLKEYAQFNNDFAAAVQAAKKAGRTPDETATSWKIPARYKGYAGPQPARLRANVQVVWDETK